MLLLSLHVCSCLHVCSALFEPYEKGIVRGAFTQRVTIPYSKGHYRLLKGSLFLTQRVTSFYLKGHYGLLKGSLFLTQRVTMGWSGLFQGG